MRSMTSIFPAFLRLLLSAALAMTIVMAQGVRGAKAQGYYDDDPDGPPPMPRQERRDSYNDNGPYDPSADDNDDYEDGRSVPDVSYFYDPLERDGRWVENLSEARFADTPEEVKELEKVGAKAVADRIVVGVYPMEVAIENGRPVALSVRERIRASHRTTLTKDWYDVPL